MSKVKTIQSLEIKKPAFTTKNFKKMEVQNLKKNRKKYPMEN